MQSLNSILKKKEVTIGLGIGLLIAIGVIVYLVWFKTPDETYKPPQQQTQHKLQAQIPQHPSEIQSVVGTGKPALVMFYAGWCGHSKTALPAWDIVSDDLNQSGQFEAIKLKEEDDKEEIKKHNVPGFPHFRLYPAGFPSDKFIIYKGDRSAVSLLKFIHSEGQDA